MTRLKAIQLQVPDRLAAQRTAGRSSPWLSQPVVQKLWEDSGGALLATPSADRPKGRSTHPRRQPREGAAQGPIVLARLSPCFSPLRGGCYDGCRRSADAELWRPCWPDIARGNRGGVGSVALQRQHYFADWDSFTANTSALAKLSIFLSTRKAVTASLSACWNAAGAASP